MTEYVSQRFLVDNTVEKREYQDKLVESCEGQSSLITLPTGTGKTIIGLRLVMREFERAAERGELEQSKAVVFVPKTTLANQHQNTFQELTTSEIPNEEIVTYTGDTRPEKREKLFEEGTIFFATATAFQNDVIDGRISLENVISIIFDECHHAVGNHAYTFIGEKYKQDNPKGISFGMSASPGDDRESILKICQNLGIENLEIVGENDELLDEHTPSTEVVERKLHGHANEIEELINEIREAMGEKVETLDDLGVLNTSNPENYAENINYQKQNQLNSKARSETQNQKEERLAMSLIAEVRTLNDFRKRLSFEGPLSFAYKFEELQDKVDQKSYEERIVNDFEDIYQKCKEVGNDPEFYTKKQSEVISTIARDLQPHLPDGGGKAIIFAETRNAVQELLTLFENQKHIDAEKLVGKQSSNGRAGMKEMEQNQVLERFENGDFDVLISTEVGEEGLDIPSVDLVLLYQPSNRAIQQVQRKGRTGREQAGKIVTLMKANTMEEYSHSSTDDSVDTMKEEMINLKQDERPISEIIADELDEEDETETQLSITEFEDDSETTETEGEFESEGQIVDSVSFGGEKPTVVADNRETSSNVVRELSLSDDVDVETKQLEVADYVVSNNSAIERKEISDFLDTLVGEERDLYAQISDLSANYENSVVILEVGEDGELDDLFKRNIHPNALYSAMVTLWLSFGVAFIPSPSEDHTAKLVEWAAKKEQEEQDTSSSMNHAKKSKMDMSEQRIYVVSSIAGIGGHTAEQLLAHEKFETVEDVFTATVEELQEVNGVGEKTAQNIRDVVDGGVEMKED